MVADVLLAAAPATSVSRSNEANSKKVNDKQIAVGGLSLPTTLGGGASAVAERAHQMASIATASGPADVTTLAMSNFCA